MDVRLFSFLGVGVTRLWLYLSTGLFSVFVGLFPTPHKGLSPLDPVLAGYTEVFHTNDRTA